MTKYLTPKVRGCLHPTTEGMGGLLKECGPHICARPRGERQGFWLVAAVGLQGPRILTFPWRVPKSGGARWVVQASLGLGGDPCFSRAQSPPGSHVCPLLTPKHLRQDG